MFVCLAVTCHLHFRQNDRDLLRATVVTRGWNGYRNKSQHRKSTLEKKILPPLLPGLEPMTFRSRVRRSNHWAIPAPHWKWNACKNEAHLYKCWSSDPVACKIIIVVAAVVIIVVITTDVVVVVVVIASVVIIVVVVVLLFCLKSFHITTTTTSSSSSSCRRHHHHHHHHNHHHQQRSQNNLMK